MNYDEMVECVRIGLGYEPSPQELRLWLYGPSGVARREAEQMVLLERVLKAPRKEWRLQALRIIRQIPSGSLISYGNLAAWTNQEYGTSITPLNTAWLRKKIYHTIGHATDIPIHRIATDGDTRSINDEKVTQEFNRRKRMTEGSLYRPHWYIP